MVSVSLLPSWFKKLNAPEKLVKIQQFQSKGFETPHFQIFVCVFFFIFLSTDKVIIFFIGLVSYQDDLKKKLI